MNSKLKNLIDKRDLAMQAAAEARRLSAAKDNEVASLTRAIIALIKYELESEGVK